MTDHDDGDYTDHDWGAFPNTVLYFHDEHETTIDLRDSVTAFTLARLARVGLTEPFGVVTAYNPYGLPRPKVMNEAREGRLLAALSLNGWTWLPVDGCSPNRAHCEPSVAIIAPLDELRALAIEHEQLAIFWFDGTQFWIIPARSSGPETPLPLR